MPQPYDLDRVIVHGCIADYHKSDFKGNTYHHVTIETPYGAINCMIDPALNPSQPEVGKVRDFVIGVEYRDTTNFNRQQKVAKRWLLEY